MAISISPVLFSRIPDFMDNLVPDAIRFGDAFDLVSGRELARRITLLTPGVKLRDSVQFRLLRAEDQTSSGLGFEMMISFDGKIHNALVHLPPADHPAWARGKMPVVLDLPGFADAPRRHSSRSHLSEAAIASGAISIALGGARGGIPAPLLSLVRMHDGMTVGNFDLGFQDGPALARFTLDNLAAQLAAYTRDAQLPNIEPTFDHAVAVGLSNGGALASELAAAGVVETAISFSGPTSPNVMEQTEGGPTNMIFVTGAQDPIVPSGGPGTFSANFITAPEAAQFFADRNGTGPLTDDVPELLAQFATEGVHIQASGDEERGLVATIAIDDNGHSVPGSDPMTGEEIDDRFGLQSSKKVSGQELLAAILERLQ